MIELPVRVAQCIGPRGAEDFMVLDSVGFIICDTCNASDPRPKRKHMEVVADALNASSPQFARAVQAVPGVQAAPPSQQTFGTRAYTVKEIDALRTAVVNKHAWGSYLGSTGQNAVLFERQYKEGATERAVEELVRTHMLAGHTAEDLIASERETTGG